MKSAIGDGNRVSFVEQLGSFFNLFLEREASEAIPKGPENPYNTIKQNNNAVHKY